MEVAKEIFKAYEDENGWISKEPAQIAKEWEEDPVKRLDLEPQLWGYYNLLDKEFENEDEPDSKWRFLN